MPYGSCSDIQELFQYGEKINGEKHGEKIDYNNNTSIKIYLNKKETRITFKVKTRYYLELLTPLGSTKKKITKDENGENVPHLEIIESLLVHWNICNKNC